MPNFRRLPNGYLHTPIAVEAPEGYSPHPTMPNVYVPNLPSCIQRQIKEPGSRCCGQRNYLYCAYFQKRVTPGDCHACKYHDAGTQRR